MNGEKVSRIRAKRKGISAPLSEVILVGVTVAIGIAVAIYILGVVNIFHEEQIKQPLSFAVLSAKLTDEGIEVTLLARNLGYKPYEIEYIIIDGGTFYLKKRLDIVINPNDTKLIAIGPGDWDEITGSIPKSSPAFVTVKIYIKDLGLQSFNIKI